MDKFNLELTGEQLNMVAQAIGELPFRIAEPLIADIRKQVGEQQVPENEVVQ
jgi:hypothetical protein